MNENERYSLEYGAGEFKLVGSKSEAIRIAREMNLDSFEVRDPDDDVVYQEFPEAVFV
jgi:hypothetical protein